MKQGLEPLHSLHLADAKLITGNHVGEARLSTSAAPAVGSYAAWIDGFPSITNPSLELPDADPDGDGRSNFLEYATGGDPTSGGDEPACEILPDGIGGMWVRFREIHAAVLGGSPGPVVANHTTRRTGPRVTPRSCASKSASPATRPLLPLSFGINPDDATGFIALGLKASARQER